MLVPWILLARSVFAQEPCERLTAVPVPATALDPGGVYPPTSFGSCPGIAVPMRVAGPDTAGSPAQHQVISDWARAMEEANPTVDLAFVVWGYESVDRWTEEHLACAKKACMRDELDDSLERELRRSRAILRAEQTQAWLSAPGRPVFVGGISPGDPEKGTPTFAGIVVHALPGPTRSTSVIKGDQGDPGPMGPPGLDGADRYEVRVNLPSTGAQLTALPMDAATSVEPASFTTLGLVAGSSTATGQGALGISVNPVVAVRRVAEARVRRANASDVAPPDGEPRVGRDAPIRVDRVPEVHEVRTSSRLLDLTLLFPVVATPAVTLLPSYLGVRARVDLLGGTKPAHPGWEELLHLGAEDAARWGADALAGAGRALGPYLGEDASARAETACADAGNQLLSRTRPILDEGMTRSLRQAIEIARKARGSAPRGEARRAARRRVEEAREAWRDRFTREVRRTVAACRQFVEKATASAEFQTLQQNADSSVARASVHRLDQLATAAGATRDPDVFRLVDGVAQLKRDEGRYLGMDLRTDVFLARDASPRATSSIRAAGGYAVGEGRLRPAVRGQAGADFPAAGGLGWRAGLSTGALLRDDLGLSRAKLDLGLEAAQADRRVDVLLNGRARWGGLAFLGTTLGYSPATSRDPREEWSIRFSYDFVRPDLLDLRW